MQMGARWAVGNSPHRSVPPVLLPAIASLEQSNAGAGSWTITWLEGLPRLALDGELRLTLDETGAVSELTPPTDGASPSDDSSYENDEDDDDWLS